MSNQMKPLALALVALAAFAVGPASADDRMIRPQCWEENVNGEIHRHCEVPNRNPVTPRPQPQAAPPLQAYEPPPQSPTGYYPPPYPGYQSTLPPRYWPGVPQQGRNWVNPCTPYVCGYGSPYGYGYPEPYYYAPGFVFGFGPFRFVIP